MGKTKVVGYTRVSTKNQSEHGFSLAEQEREIQQYCTDNGFELVELFTDEGISGASVDDDTMEVSRAGLQMMLDRLQQKDIKFVVVLSTSRLWRSDLAKALIVHKLKKVGVDIKAIDRPDYSVYANTPADVLMQGFIELIDVYEIADIKMKLQRGREEKARQGGYSGGKAPFGYKSKRGSKVLEINEKEAATVRRCYEFAKSPNLTYEQIASLLTVEGHRNRAGRPISATLVYRILHNYSFYIGLYQYGGITAKGQHPPILCISQQPHQTDG